MRRRGGQPRPAPRQGRPLAAKPWPRPPQGGERLRPGLARKGGRCRSQGQQPVGVVPVGMAGYSQPAGAAATRGPTKGADCRAPARDYHRG
ncbi:hypothetical protein BHM03_00058977 [Ensete ventricosum]|nr:hypothetical protein BHM03_00058977 [Ensete ventricosum]